MSVLLVWITPEDYTLAPVRRNNGCRTVVFRAIRQKDVDRRPFL